MGYTVIMTCSYPPMGIRDPATNTIIDVNSPGNTDKGYVYVNGSYRPVVAASTWQMICLAFSRISAFSMYPVLIAVFFSKCKATLNVIHKTPLSLKYPGLSTDSHHLHAYAGSYIAYAVILHALFHILRWANQGNMYLLVESRAGISGLIASLSLPLIACLMLYDYLKRKISYEIRRKFHTLFYLFALALCCHVPPSALPGGGFIGPAMGFTIIYYFLDASYVSLFMTEKIQTPIFQVLKSGFQITMTVSSSFKKRLDQGGFVYVCLPWVDSNRNEWHAFSLFEFPYDDNKRQIFIQNLGDWTNKVHEALQRDTARPMWVQGPFKSAFHNAENYDNQILVATGIGITPILSAVSAYNKTRRVNIVWIVREDDMLTFFLEYLNINKGGWMLVFYTGKTELHPVLSEYWSESNIKIITGRPTLGDLIPNIIYGIESGNQFYSNADTNSVDSQTVAVSKVVSHLGSMEYGNVPEKEIRKRAYDELRSSGYQLTSILSNAGTNIASSPTNADHSISIPQETKESDKQVAITTENDSLQHKEVTIATENYYDVLRFSSTMPPMHQEEEEENNDELQYSSTTTMPQEERQSFLNSQKTESAANEKSSNFIKTLNEINKSIMLRSRKKASLLKTKGASLYQPWKNDIDSSDFVNNLDEKIRETWGIFFCGCNKFVLKDLDHASKRYGIDLHTESFFW